MSGRAFEASGERIDEEIGSRPMKSTPVRRRSGARVSSRGRPPRDASGLHASDAYASSSEVIVSILPTDGDMKARQKRATMAGGISPRTSFTNGLARRRPFMSEMVPHGPLAHRSSFAARQSAMHSQFITLDADPTPVYKRRIAAFIDGTRVTLFMTAVTLWTLFGDDIRLLAFAQEDDRIFVYVVYVCFFLFALEMILACVAKRDYPFSFFFWLDTMATMSLLIDIPEFMAATGFPECYHDADFFMSADWSLLEHSDLSGISSESIEVGGGGVPTSALDGGTTGAIARAGRAARVGTRLGRILRMVRLLRVFKLYKSWHGVNNRSSTTGEDTDTKAPLKTKKTDTLLDDVAAEAEDDEILRKTEETRVGARLSDLTTRRVIVGVLALLFMLPLFDLHTYDSRTGLEHGGLRMLHTMFVTNPGTERSDGFYDAVETYASQAKGMYALVVDGVDFAAHPKTDFTLNPDIGASLRCEEHQYTTYVSEADGSISYAFFEMRDDSRLKASLNMGRTAFVCFVLGLGAMLFSKDANTLVLKPIERMVKKVREVSENPLKRFEVFEDDDDGSTQMETRMLENSIAKICGLLAVGFGEAGSEVIAENMKRGGEINPMIPGKKIVAIFGFCDIRQFTDTTEVLQEGVMEFVNTIGKIVHMEVHLHGGSANKNIGDAFLLVWKFPKEITLADVENPERTTPAKRAIIAEVANNALASFVIIMASLRRSARLNRYRRNLRLNKRMPNFEVKMGFGLHVGWAIEGAIGSEFKVDASYLSPNVNLSARLEAATKQFGVPLLISEEFVRICGERVRAQCRQIDRVTVKGSIEPMGIFTYDTCVEAVPEPAADSDPTISPEDESNSFIDYEDEFAEHPDIVALRQGVTQHFLSEFARGFQLYSGGDWERAAQVLRGVSESTSKDGGGQPDGPTAALLNFMNEHHNRAPKGWMGYRELTEK